MIPKLSFLEILDPTKISKEEKILNELREFGIYHAPSELNSGWNYVLDHVWLVKKIGAFVKRLPNSDLIILDVECGNSVFHNFLEQKFNLNIIGIDRPAGYCNVGEQKNVDFHEDFLSLEKFGTNSVDLIIWLSAMEHNEYHKIRQLFLKSKRLLKPGGMFLATIGIAKQTFWFGQSEQTNLSIDNCKRVFDIQKVVGDFDTIRSMYQNDVLHLREKYLKRNSKFNEKDPEFLVGAISVTKEASTYVSNRGLESTNSPLNILLYLEPLIVRDRPYLYQWWLDWWSQMVTSLISNKKFKFSFKLVTSESVESVISQFNVPSNINVISISQEKLLKLFDFSAMDASLAWYNQTYTNEQMDYTAKLFAHELCEWKPDIIISSSPVPFLKKNYPDAAVFHFEVGMTSRPPFPLSFYLDPMRYYKNSILTKKCDEINNVLIDQFEKYLLNMYRNFFKHLISSNNPFSKFIKSYKDKFDFIVLLPLQVEGFWLNGNCQFHSQFQFVHKLLSNIPPNIGVVITTHPDGSWITPDIEKYFKSVFVNFIYSSEIQKVKSASQYFLDDIDAVLSVSSMVGLQALIWGKKVYAIGETQLKVAADYCFQPDLSDIYKLTELLKAQKKDKDNVLFWLLTKYFVPRRYFFDTEWLGNYIIRIYKANRIGKLSINLFENIDDPEILFSHIIEEAILGIPQYQD